MPRDWEWDPSLYTGAAEHYANGRFGYPAGLADALAAHLPARPGRLLDVGCGPGSFTLEVACTLTAPACSSMPARTAVSRVTISCPGPVRRTSRSTSSSAPNSARIAGPAAASCGTASALTRTPR